MRNRTSPHLHRQGAGTSLPELLCVMVLLGIVLAAAAPAMDQLTARHRLVAATNSLVTGLHFARHSAVYSRRTASLCPSRAPARCGSNEDWQHGWYVHAPAHAPVRDSYSGTLPARITVRLSQGRQQVRFQPDGRSPGSNITLHLCSHGIMQRQIVVNNAGRVRSTPITHTPCD